MNLKNTRVLVYDLGLFTEQALRLLRDCAEVWYFCPWIDAFPEPFQEKIGDGLDGMQSIKYFFEFKKKLKKTDFIFLPDTLCWDIAADLRDQGYPVAAAGTAEILEQDRWHGRQVQRKLGLPTQDTWRIVGITEARKFLSDKKDLIVKIDCFRGVQETFEHIDYEHTEPILDKMAWQLGPYKEDVVFILEVKLEGVEPGIDAQNFRGETIYPIMVGYEEKGVGIIERVYDTPADFPAPLRKVDEGFSKEFKKHGTSFFYSFETKIKKDRLAYTIDPSIRLAAPGTSAIQSEIIKNYSEVVAGMAMGEKVTPVFSHRYGASVSMDSDEAKDSWYNISFPKELRRWVKLRMAVKKNGDYYAIPGFDSIGSVIGLSDTIHGAIGLVKERAEQVRGKRLNKDVHLLENNILPNIEEGRKYGINF